MRTRASIIVLNFLILFVVFGECISEAEIPSPAKFNVGMIVDEESVTGKVVRSCVSMAVSDFDQFINTSIYETEIHIRDSKGDPSLALTAALDLLENVKVQAILVPEMFTESAILATLADKARVPLVSFSSIPSPNHHQEHPFFVQISEDESIEFQAIAAFIELRRWRNVILIYEDTDNGSSSMLLLDNILKRINSRVVYKSAISPLGKDYEVMEELVKIMRVQTSIFIVHMLPSLASRLLLNANRLGMIGDEYAWILTSKSMNFLNSSDAYRVAESMQGLVGFKSYIPPSKRLANFTSRWRMEFQLHNKSDMRSGEINVRGIKAYDAIWALSMAIEELGSRNAVPDGDAILNEILRCRFTGLGGEFQLVNGKLIAKTYEIMNVIGNGFKGVGFWTLNEGFSSERIDTSFVERYGSNTRRLSSTTPNGLSFNGTRHTNKLRILIPVHESSNLFTSVRYDYEKNATVAIGFSVDVFIEAFKHIEESIPYEFIPFVITGHIEQVNGTYDDMLNEVYHGRFDGVVGDTTITSDRYPLVDFTIPYTDIGVGTVARAEKQGMWFFLNLMDADLWIVTAISFISVGFIVWLIEHRMNEQFQGSVAQQIGTTLSFAFSTLVYAHRENLRSNLSRFVVTIWLFIVFILTSSYTASLSSQFTVQRIQLAKGDYIGYQTGTILAKSVIKNLHFSYRRLKTLTTLEDYHEALSKGSKNGGVGAIVDEIPYLKAFLAKYPSQYSIIGSASAVTNGFGFAFRRGSPLVPALSGAIAKMREEGRLSDLEEKWFTNNYQSSFVSEDAEESEAEFLSLANFRGLFIVSVTSKVIALSI